MVNLYKLEPNDNFQKVILKHESQWLHVLDQLLIGKQIDNWQPLEIGIHDNDLKAGDYPTSMVSLPTFSEKAATKLNNLLENDGQILPLLPNNGQYYFYNVLSVVDGLNEKESELIRFDDGRIMYIGKYVLKNNDYSKFQIFKLKNLERDYVFVTEPFREKVINYNLKGFDFIKVEVY